MKYLAAECTRLRGRSPDLMFYRFPTDTPFPFAQLPMGYICNLDIY